MFCSMAMFPVGPYAPPNRTARRRLVHPGDSAWSCWSCTSVTNKLFEAMLSHRSSWDFNTDIDIKLLFSKVDSPEKKQLWTFNKIKTRQKWRVFKENQL